MLAEEMLHGRSLRIEVAAGLDETTLGTDAVSISAAIERADGPGRRRRADGPRQRPAQRRAGARPPQRPDGAGPGDALPGAHRRGAGRRGGRRGRRREPRGGGGRGARRADGQGRAPGRADRRASRRQPRPEEVVGVFTVENPHGLHARPAARLVSEVRTLDASVQLRNLTTGAGPVPAASLSRVATLAAVRGHEVEVRASGPQAQEAVEHLLTLATRRFDESDEDVVEVTPAAPADRRAASGPLPASPGIAIGPVRRLSAAPRTRTSGRAGAGRPRRGLATHRRGRGDRAPGDRARPGPDRERGGRRPGRHLRRPPVAARRRRDARRRQGPARRAASEPSPPGRAAWPRSRPSGRAFPTPTCASARPTYARWASRCSGP